MLARTVDDSCNRLMIFLKIGAKMDAFAFEIAVRSAQTLDVFILLYLISDVIVPKCASINNCVYIVIMINYMFEP